MLLQSTALMMVSTATVLFAFLVTSTPAVSIPALNNGTQSQACSVTCALESNRVRYGFDANKNPVWIDVKRCTKVFLSSSLGTLCATQAAAGDCQKECTPRSHTIESHSNRTGPFTVATIRRCHANTHHCQRCQRRPNAVYVFSGSKYQTRIDVGKCSGECEVAEEEQQEEGSGADWMSLLTSPPPPPPSLSCRPTRTKNVAVEGPNGYETTEVIEQCSCVQEQCYRVDHFQSVSVLYDGRRQEKVVNVGKCAGSCHGVYLNGYCLQYNSLGQCSWYMPGTRGKCRPTAGSLFTYTDTAGTNKTIPVVDECGCDTG